jgi:c-di-GMP-binding flagellar brake protein YcgR
MTSSFEQERREFVRIKLEIPIRYKFVAPHIKDERLEKIYEGYTSNLSAGGLLLKGPVPDFGWIAELLLGKMVLGVNILLPTEIDPIKSLVRVAWVEALDEKTKFCTMGIKFKEMTREDQDKIFKFVIRSQMPS